MTRLSLATRGSALAMAQANLTKALLEAAHPGLEVTLVTVRTTGDIATAPLASMGGVGVFVKELERGLLAGEADLAVHSLKDLPTVLPEGLCLAAVLEREDPRDALITRSGGGLGSLAPGARVATGSPRRRALLLAARPDLVFVEVRGNVDTRLEKLARGEFDALVLALAGLKRLGRSGEVSERLDPELFPCAPGQAAIGLEALVDSAAARLARALEHGPTRREVDAERAFLLAIGGGCAVPVGALARAREDGSLTLTAVIADPRGGKVMRERIHTDAAAGGDAGRALAERMLAAGGRALLTMPAPLAGRRIVVAGRAGAPGEIESRLRDLGASVESVAAIATMPPADASAFAAAVAALDQFQIVAVTSRAGALAVATALRESGSRGSSPSCRFAAVGAATARALREAGLAASIVSEGTGADLARAILLSCDAQGLRVLLPRAAAATPDLPAVLRAAGAEVVEVEAYRTVPSPDLGRDLAALQHPEGIDVWVVQSPSAVAALMATDGAFMRSSLIACLGPTTSAAARAAGLTVAVVADFPRADELVGALVRHFAESREES